MMRRILCGLLVAGLVMSVQSAVWAQDKGVKKPAKPVVQQAAVADVYVCPMHPEETATKAGKCTKCGMALEKKAVKAPAAVPQQKKAPAKHEGKSGKCAGCQEPCGE